VILTKKKEEGGENGSFDEWRLYRLAKITTKKVRAHHGRLRNFSDLKAGYLKRQAIRGKTGKKEKKSKNTRRKIVVQPLDKRLAAERGAGEHDGTGLTEGVDRKIKVILTGGRARK